MFSSKEIVRTMGEKLSPVKRLVKQYQEESRNLLLDNRVLTNTLCRYEDEWELLQKIFAWDYARKAGRPIYELTHNPFVVDQIVSSITNPPPHSFETQTKAEVELKSLMDKAIEENPYLANFAQVARRISNMFIFCLAEDRDSKYGIETPRITAKLLETYRDEILKERENISEI